MIPRPASVMLPNLEKQSAASHVMLLLLLSAAVQL
jgi:hypothetical protein